VRVRATELLLALALVYPQVAGAIATTTPGATVETAAPIQFALVIAPQRRPLNPLLLRTGTPVQDCRDLSNLDRTIRACTIVNASKNLSRKTRAIALSNRCSAYQLKGMLDKAIADCDRAVGHDRTNADAFYNRGRAYRKKGELQRAIADYSEAIQLSQRSAKTAAKNYNNRGDAYAAAGDTERAVADFEQAVALEPTYAKGYYNRGAIYSRMGDLDRAIADYTRAVELDPTFTRAFSARGNAYRGKRELQRAVADYKAALRLDPRDGRALRSLGLLTAELEGSASARSSVDLPSEDLQVE
jgi:tetratricopeptide (TPR) repeat protein